MLRMLNGFALVAAHTIRGWRIRLGRYLLGDEMQPVAQRVVSMPQDLPRKLRAPGLDCPACGALIPMTTGDLLAGGHVACGSCGLELSLDRDASAESLAALQRHVSKLDGLESSVRATGASVRRE